MPHRLPTGGGPLVTKVPSAPKVFVHQTADVSPQATVGEGSFVWHQAQLREGARVGRNCRIGKGVYIDRGVVVGDDCKLQNYAVTYEGVKLGDRVFVGPHAVFTNDLYPRAESKDWKIVPTLVKEGASIGANATIVCGITIGRYAMVAAGAVVTTDVPDQALVMGVPARVVGFVCECGQRLQDGRCPKCGRAFKLGKGT